MNPTHIDFTGSKHAIRRWMLISLIVGGVLIALPTWVLGTPPDFNDDGAVDFCDAITFSSIFYMNDLRADLNGDGVVDAVDILLFAQAMCTGPSKTAVNGTATIGVYFDTAGLNDSLVNVPANTLVTFYVVAHGVTEVNGIGGYTFRVAENSTSTIVDDAPPAGFIYGGSDAADNPGVDMGCAIGTATDCPGPGSSIVLNTYTLYFTGDDTTMEVVGLNDCAAPSVSPSYVSCGVEGVPCDWTYFSYGATNGRAFITSGPVAAEAQSWSTVKALYR